MKFVQKHLLSPQFSAKIINILIISLRYNRPIEILVKLVSVFNLAKNSLKISIAFYFRAFSPKRTDMEL